MRNALLKTAAMVALTVTTFSTAHAVNTLNVARTSDIPLPHDVLTGAALTGTQLASAAAYLGNTNVNAWCGTASICTAYSTSSGEFRSNQYGGILNQLLQVSSLTAFTVTPALPAGIKLETQYWYQLPNPMAFRIPKVSKSTASADIMGTATITASEWNSCVAKAFSIVLTYASPGETAQSSSGVLTLSSLYGNVQAMIQCVGEKSEYNSISACNAVLGDYQMPSFTVYDKSGSNAATVSILCKVFY